VEIKNEMFIIAFRAIHQGAVYVAEPILIISLYYDLIPGFLKLILRRYEVTTAVTKRSNWLLAWLHSSDI
jgi:hypothetical protein